MEEVISWTAAFSLLSYVSWPVALSLIFKLYVQTCLLQTSILYHFRPNKCIAGYDIRVHVCIYVFAYVCLGGFDYESPLSERKDLAANIFFLVHI